MNDAAPVWDHGDGGRDGTPVAAGDGTGRSAARDADLSPVTTQTYELRYSRNPILMSLAVLDYA